MELKDVILSTLAEMEDGEASKKVSNSSIEINEIKRTEQTEVKEVKHESPIEISSSNAEILFLNSLRERLLVLFEGFQAPNNTNIEAKVDMTLNFLEYALATIDSRATQLEKGKLK